jgi:hypothetical protein
VYIYIYIYIERERERDSNENREEGVEVTKAHSNTDWCKITSHENCRTQKLPSFLLEWQNISSHPHKIKVHLFLLILFHLCLSLPNGLPLHFSKNIYIYIYIYVCVCVCVCVCYSRFLHFPLMLSSMTLSSISYVHKEIPEFFLRDPG